MSRLNNRFAYWCAGMIGLAMHPIKVPVELAKMVERTDELELRRHYKVTGTGSADSTPPQRPSNPPKHEKRTHD